MALNVSQEQKQLQTQTLNQSLIESLHLLTLPSTELESYLEKECEKNPLLKIVKKDSIRDVDKSYVSSSSIQKSENYQMMLNQVSQDGETLYTHLQSQIGLLKFSEDEKTIANLILSALDSNGLLTTDINNLLKNTTIQNKKDIFNNVRETIKHLDPIGVASFSVWEAMQTQVEEMYISGHMNQNEYNITIKTLNEEGFNIIAKGGYSLLSKWLNIDIEDAKDIIFIIKTLNPYPSTGYRSSPSNYILPELSIKKNEDNTLTISLINDYIPDITIDDEYIKLLSKTDNEETKKYIEQYRKKAESLINAVHERDNTLLLIGKTLATKQYNFFMKGPSFIAPLSLKDVALEINRDESTISRISSSKYIETDYGTFSIKTFFSRSGGTTSDGTSISRDKIKMILKNIIDETSKQGKKLSDEKLKTELEKRDIFLSRRTIAKYRGELGIKSSQNKSPLI